MDRDRAGYPQNQPNYTDEEFAPLSQNSDPYPARKATVLRVSSAQKKRPPTQGMQGYEDDETQRPTLKYDQVYDGTPGKPNYDPFSPNYQGVSPYRKSQRGTDPTQFT